MDTIHRILTGLVMTRKDRAKAGYVVMGWILIDVIQFVDWLIGKF